MTPALCHFRSVDLALAHEQELLRQVAEEGGFAAVLWTTGHAVVLPSGLQASPGFAAACEKATAHGWPVFIRSTGGGASPQGPGVLNLSIAVRLPPQPTPSIRQCYDLVCTPIVDVLAAHGVSASLGPVPGSFCDGAYNVTVDGRKLAGTAQRWHHAGVRGRQRTTCVLAHAAILFDDGFAGGLEAIRAFERALGRPCDLRLDAHCTVAAACARAGASVSLPQFAQQLADATVLRLQVHPAADPRGGAFHTSAPTVPVFLPPGPTGGPLPFPSTWRHP